MTLLIDFLLGLWIVAVAAIAFAVVPALTLGRPAGRTAWWPDVLAGVVWTVLAVIVLVPVLAALHLLNWATALLVPLAWPIVLWLYRYRGAPVGAFRALCRRTTLSVLMWMKQPPTAHDAIAQPRRSQRAPTPLFSARSAVSAVALIAAAALLFWTTARELRFSSPADYDVLAHTRAMLAGGHWIADPAASLAAVLSRVAAVDPMQALRFLRPLTAPGSIVAAALPNVSLNAACAWTAVIAAVLLALVAVQGVHRRDRWHVVAAGAVAALSFSAAGRTGIGAADAVGSAGTGGYVEYDAAPRQALNIARDFADRPWAIVAPPEQRVEIGDPRRFIALAEFVRRFGDRAGDRRFRFDVPGRDLFVFVERTPLHVPPGAALAPGRYSSSLSPGAAYWMPNARVRLERQALELCERYRRSHARAAVYFEDANLRVYHFPAMAAG
jgi:hypothetical protein